MQKMAGGFADAVTPSPRVISATDPTSLSAPNHTAGAALNYHAARVYESQGKNQSAIGLYEKALQIDPDLQPALVAYARLLDREGNFAKAESLYQRALQQQPANTIALNDLGMMYARQGRLPDAAAQLNRAIQLQPMNQRYRNNIAIVLIDAGRIDEAYGHLAAVHGEANAHYNLGFLLSERQLNADALQHLNQALALNPNLEPAHQLASQLASTVAPNAPFDPRYQPVSAGPPGNVNYHPQTTIPGPNTRPLPPL
jgi:tetratricopeptide (TPR) repeat protein